MIEQKMDQVHELASPITEKEFQEMIEHELQEMTESNLSQLISERYRKARKSGHQVTKWDVYDMLIEIDLEKKSVEGDHWKFAVTNEEMRERGETYILPKNVSLTPMPDLEEYDPEEYYNMREDLSTPIRPNLNRKEDWYDLPTRRPLPTPFVKEHSTEHDPQKAIVSSIINREKVQRFQSRRDFYRKWEVQNDSKGVIYNKNEKTVSDEEWQELTNKFSE
jgi:hypothetical protein